jgi:hypothetical protein
MLTLVEQLTMTWVVHKGLDRSNKLSGSAIAQQMGMVYHHAWPGWSQVQILTHYSQSSAFFFCFLGPEPHLQMQSLTVIVEEGGYYSAESSN